MIMVHLIWAFLDGPKLENIFSQHRSKENTRLGRPLGEGFLASQTKRLIDLHPKTNL